MKTFLAPLVLDQKSRIALQVALSIVLILSLTSSYYGFPEIAKEYSASVKNDVELKWYTYLIVTILAVIPGVFVFQALKQNLDLEVES
jgi:hypothetical protein